MRLDTFLQQNIPGQTFSRKTPAKTYEIIESEALRLICTVGQRTLIVSYFQVTVQGIQFGDVMLAFLISFCRQAKLVPIVSCPQSYCEKFWRRNGFQPSLNDMRCWVYQEH